MANKTVIIAFNNEAYVEPHENEYPSMFDIFLEGFWVGEKTRQLVDHLLVVSMDKTAHERCQFRRLNCYRLAAEEDESGGVSFAGEKVFMSDLQISTDRYNGDPFSDQNPINTGFYFIRSNNKTTSLFQKWYDMRVNSPGMKEQDVLGNLIKHKVLRELNVSARFLDTSYFSGFCSGNQDVGLVATVHANCCRTIKAKVVDLKAVLRDWKRSMPMLHGKLYNLY
ncbi:hypothetical protein ACS0TY_014844 [Phlomoides rotata]